MRLITKEEWESLPPFSQGYCLYMQEELPGSELKGLRNPYHEDTRQYEEFRRGETSAVLEVQDGEE